MTRKWPNPSLFKWALLSLIPFIMITLFATLFPEQLQAFDINLSGYFYNIGPNWLTPIIQYFTLIGDSQFVTPFVITIMAIYWLLMGRFRVGLWYGFQVLVGASFLKNLAKNIFSRPRPNHIDHLIEVTEWSFPSGHAMVAIIAYGGLLFLLLKYAKSNSYKILLILITLTIVLTLGFSRLYLGVHYVSDIIGGYSLGLAWLLFAIAFSPRSHIKTRVR